MTAQGVNPSSPYAPCSYAYDPAGRLSTLVNPFSERTSFAYDGADRLTKKTLTDGYNGDGFGNLMSQVGSYAMGLAWGEASGYRSDNDSGLRLLGHRYYESRTGRFISQDPAGAGSNWYVYAYNDPMDRTDPLGLDVPLGDFGLRPGDQYNVDPISAGRAGMNVQLSQSAGLIAQFQYFSVDRVTTTHWSDGKTTVTSEHLFDFAVPNGTSLRGNFGAAQNYANSNHVDSKLLSLSGATALYSVLWDKSGDAGYVYHHFANKTVGDFKDKNFPGIGQPAPGTRLWALADNGGNMNGGMGMEGLGMSSWEVAKSGDAHIAMMSGFAVLHDDPMGAAVLQVGWHYAQQFP